jgi:predicted RND superfamily exporter protein
MPRPRRTSGLHHRLIAFVFAVVHRPRLTLALAALALAGASALAWFKLDVSTDQDQLFSSKVPFFRDYLGFTRAFPENQAGYVIIQAKHPDHAPAVDRWTGLADAIADRLAADHDDVRAVAGHVSVDEVGPQGLLFSNEPTEVPRARASIERLLPLVQRWGEKPDRLYNLLGPSPLQRFVSGLSHASAQDLTEGAPLINLMAKSWCQTLDDPHRPVAVGGLVPNLADLEASSPRDKGYSYIVDTDPNSAHPGQHLLLIKLFEKANLTSKDGLIKVIASIRRDIAEASAPYAAEFDVGLSGRPALDADELETTDRDSRRAEIVSLTAVFLGLVLFLRSVWLAVAAEIALVVGIGWTFGWATISTAIYNHAPRGDLNLLSMVFLIALIGIGMDYLIQVLTRYRQEAVRHGHEAHRDARAIWAGVFKHVAAPINTACLGAAGAFLVSIFTPFRGAAELGLIAGGGLLLCLATGYIILPALLAVFPPRIKPTDAERAGANAHLAPDEVAAGTRSRRNRRLVLPAIWAALLIAGVPLMRRTTFDPGLLTLQAQNLQSVKLIRKLPTWFEVELTPDLDLLRRVRTAVEQLPTVDHTESVLNATDNYAYLKGHPLPQIPWVEPTPVSGADLPGIAERALALADRLSTTVSADPTSFMTAAGSLRAFAARLQSAAHGAGAAPDLAAQRLTLWQQAFVGELHMLLAPFYPAPPDVHALPETIRGHLLGTDGRYALYIYPKQDCWQQANLVSFVTTVEAAVKTVPGAPPATGVASDVFHSTDETHAAFRDATLYALGLIFVLVLIDLRNLRQTLLAISVLALGLPMLVAVMGLLGMHWNFANFFGLPILIGAGHEYGVFMVHRYNEACRDAHRPWRKWDVSDRALLLCGYVTSISFGFFWLFGHHLGLKSLGLVMALGIACIYLATVCVLRPLLLWKLAAGEGCAVATARPEAGRAKEPVPG